VTTLATSQAAGTAHLTFARCGEETILTRSFATSPVKILATKRGRAACWIYAATLGGGLVGGDRVRVTANVGTGAYALITTQASTKVYRSQKRASQSMHATLDRGALLVVLPDPVVCFSGADFTQTQRYDLRGDASLVVLDWMTSGRHEAGERWAFSRYESRLAILRDDREILSDALVLEHDLDSVAERMARFEVLLTAVLTGPLVAESAASILKHANQCSITKRADLILSASALRDGGTLVRMAGVSVEQVGRALRDSFIFLRPLLGDDPWSRKW
jgi:urease accessory protein